MNEKILEFIIQLLPSIVAGLTCIFTMFKVLGGIEKWQGSINDTNLNQLSKDRKNVVKRNIQLTEAYRRVLTDNEELKQQLKEILIAMDKKATEEIPKEEE